MSNTTKTATATPKPEKSLNGKMDAKTNKQVSAAIYHAVEMEMAFKLYSYRLIEPTDYLERVKELNGILTKSLK